MRRLPLIYKQGFCTFVNSAKVHITIAKFYFEIESNAATIELNELMDLINFFTINYNPFKVDKECFGK